MNKDQQERAILLLDVAQKLMTKVNESPYGENILYLTESWGGAECDGYCLMEDIKDFMDEIEDNV